MTKSSLITLRDPRAPAAEAYRTLRSNLIFANLETPLQTVLVTSAAAEEGKSTTIANLAVVMAQGGRRTILVDCDLRRPTLHSLFDLPSAPGFSEWMANKDDTSPALAPTGIDGLSLLPAGSPPANPADLLSSRRVETLVAHLKAQADFVLFDAPPLLAVSDAAVLATNVDGAVLVVSAGQTRRDHAQRAKEILEKIHVRIVGAVLANAPKEDGLNPYA